jgi:hypothetical protein
MTRIERVTIPYSGAAELADRAAFGSGARFERLHRYQTARGRKLLRTVDTLRKMQKVEVGTSDDECQMANDKGQRAPDGREGDKHIEPKPQEVQGDLPCRHASDDRDLAVGQDSNPVIRVPNHDKIGILSHGGTELPNEANLVETQVVAPQRVQLKTSQTAMIERSQSVRRRGGPSGDAGGWDSRPIVAEVAADRVRLRVRAGPALASVTARPDSTCREQ